LAKFEKLFEPIKIKSMTVPNRIMMPALTVNIAIGPVNDAVIAYYERRARGGAGLIVAGISSVVTSQLQGIDMATDDRIPGHRRLTDAIHKYETKASIQLWHPGRYEITFDPKYETISASDVTPPIFSRKKPRPMSIEEIEEMVEKFAAAADRAVKAGYDAVEFVASAGYLIAQFMSPVTNLRTDKYGGPLENRARFGAEIIRAARKKVGDDFPIMIRMVGDEFLPGGNTIEEMKRFARIWEDAGADLFNVTAGWHESKTPMITMNVPRGGYVWMAESIKKALDHAPVAASNRINDPELAESILREGRADMVSMARALVADPDLPRKAREGRINEIRKCIACMNCMDSLFTGVKAQCSLNAEACRELELGGDIGTAAQKKKVVVIGGGPAGCEAARVAKMRGHDVVLFEKGAKLGGQLNLAATTPGFGEFAEVPATYSHVLQKAGVDIRLNTPATVENVIAEKPDQVIYAAGAVPNKPPIPGIGLSHVVDAWDVMGGRNVNGDSVVVIGGGGTGCDVAMHLAHQKKKVTIVEMLPKVGHNIGPGSRWVVLQTLQELGVEMRPNFKVKEIQTEHVTGERDGREEKIPAEAVVLALGSKPERALFDKLKEKNVPVQCVGDAVEPRKIVNAIHDGYNAARAI